MFAVDHVLVSDDVAEARFACDLAACRGACCIVGDAGAPITPDERERLDAAFPVVQDRLTDEARRVVAAQGTWEETAPGRYNTACVEGPAGPGACVFVTYTPAGVALCAIEAAYREGRFDWPKPVSCHLYPLRITTVGDLDVVNYERIELCDPARACGAREGVYLADMVAGPLERAYGAAWRARFQSAVAERRAFLAAPGGAPADPA